MLLVPPTQQLGQPVVSIAAGLVVGGKATTVHPRRAALDRHDPVRGAVEQFAVVRDQQHRLLRRG